jgi:hypothetical protein
MRRQRLMTKKDKFKTQVWKEHLPVRAEVP